MKEHIQSAPPRPQPKSAHVQQLEAALTEAEVRLEKIKATCQSPSRPLAIRAQEKIIAQYKRQIAELTEDSWLM